MKKLPRITPLPAWLEIGGMLAALYAIFAYVRKSNTNGFECITSNWCVDNVDAWWWLAGLDTLLVIAIIIASYIGWGIAMWLFMKGWAMQVGFFFIWATPIGLTALGFSHYGKDMSEFWGFLGLSSFFWLVAIVLTIAYLRKLRTINRSDNQD